MESGQRPLGYFAPVDGLRAVAILSVLIYHLRPGRLPGGFVGVDIFFVISGFVVTASIVHLRFDRLRDLLAYFYARRMVRILPALLLVLALTGLASLYFVPGRALFQILDTGAAAFVAASNIVLAFEGNNYFFPDPRIDPFLHTWTLGVEEQFYLVFPFFIYFAQKGLLAGRGNRRAIVAVALAGALSLALCAWLTRTNPSQAFYQMPSRFWELALGMILCLTVARWRPLLAGLDRSHVLALSALFVAMLAIFLAWVPLKPFPFPAALVPTMATAGLIALVVARPEALVARGLALAPIVHVGKLSYSLYLWHWPVFALFRWTTGLDTPLLAAAAVAIAFLGAIVSYHLVERPIRLRHRRRPFKHRNVIAVGVSVCIAGAALLAGSMLLQLYRLEQAYFRVRNVPPGWTACRADRPQARSLPGGSHEIWEPTCRPVRPERLIVVGDSHARAYSNLLGHASSDRRMTVHLYYSPACDFPRLFGWAPVLPACARFQRAVSDELAGTLRPGDILFMPSLRVPRFGDRQRPLDSQAEAAAYREARDLLRRLSATGARLIFEAPKPIFRSPLYRCSDWFNRGNPVCAGGFETSRAEMERLRARPLRILSLLAADVRGIEIWDPLPVLCPGDPCRAAMNDRPLFIDTDHLDHWGNDLLYPGFRAFIASGPRPEPRTD